MFSISGSSSDAITVGTCSSSDSISVGIRVSMSVVVLLGHWFDEAGDGTCV